MADLILKAVRDTDVLARVDEHEFHLLLPETDGLGAHAFLRRVYARVSGDRGGVGNPGPVMAFDRVDRGEPAASDAAYVRALQVAATFVGVMPPVGQKRAAGTGEWMARR